MGKNEKKEPNKMKDRKVGDLTSNAPCPLKITNVNNGSWNENLSSLSISKVVGI